MTNSWRIRESVINWYLGGKSFDQIASESSIAKGSVFNIINAWKNRIEIPDIEELREFSKMIRKSGMTINQCAQSFRFIRMLDSFGITDEPDPSYFQNIDTNYRYTSESKDSLIDPNKSNGERKKHHSPSLRDNFYYFIENIYNNCKKHDIRSSNVIRWIEDLIEINPSLSGNTLKILTEFENDIIEQKGFQSLSTNKKPVSKKPEDEQNQREVQIPFISKISGYIEQKKIKLQNLDIYKNKLEQEIGGLEEQKNILLSTITNLRRKESITLTYVDWIIA